MSKSYLQPYDNRVEIENWLPILPQDIQTYVSLEIDVRMIYLLRALDFRRIVREILVDFEVEGKKTGFVHALVRFDDQ